MFDNMVITLNLQTLGKSRNFKISEKEFEEFCKGYLFEELKGERNLGTYFCDKYNENNNVLRILNNNAAREHIKKFYVK